MNRFGLSWAQLHGASTHFPVVLSLVAFGCDLAAICRWQRPEAAGLSRAALGAVLLAAGGSVVAATTGLVLARGEIWGDGDLGAHHRFVWPAFGLMVGAAVWRWLMHAQLTRRDLAVYLGAIGTVAALFVGASYFGGEMLLSANAVSPTGLRAELGGSSEPAAVNLNSGFRAGPRQTASGLNRGLRARAQLLPWSLAAR